MKRWLAHELTRRDGSLQGFWPMVFDLADHAGQSRHARQAFPAAPNNPEVSPGRMLTNVSGRSGYAFDGTRVLSCGINDDFLFGYEDSFSVSIWFCRTGETESYTPLVAKTSSYVNFAYTTRGWDVSIVPFTSSGEIGLNVQFRIMGDAHFGYGLWVTSKLVQLSSMDIGKWHHLLVSYDGSHDAISGMNIYLDGVPARLAISSNTPVYDPIAATNKLWIGGANYEHNVTTVANNIVVDMVRVWNRKVQPNEVIDLYRRERTAFTKKALLMVAPPFAESLSLYLAGFDSGAISTSLFVSSNELSRTEPALPLVTVGEADHDWTPLVVPKTYDVRTQVTTLWVNGIPFFVTVPLVIPGYSIQTRGMSLVVKAEPVPSSSLLVSLFVSGSGQSSVVRAADLFVEGGKWSQVVQMVLFLLGSPTDRTVRNMNLFVRGETTKVIGSIELYLQNNQQGRDSIVPLFLKVDDGYPLSESMVLFLERPFEESVPLYLHGPGHAIDSSLVTLLIESALILDENMTLVIPSTLGVISAPMKLFTHGW